jgi:hypothetical protein
MNPLLFHYMWDYRRNTIYAPIVLELSLHTISFYTATYVYTALRLARLCTLASTPEYATTEKRSDIVTQKLRAFLKIKQKGK